MENLQQPSPQSWMLIMLAILFSFCFTQSSGDLLLEKPQQQQQQCASIDLIQKACNGSVDEDFCISSLKSDPRTITTDPTELTAITIDIAKKNATAILAFIDDELMAKGHYNSSVIFCGGNYQNAVQILGRADVAFKGRLYPSTSQFIQDAIIEVLYCRGDEIKTAPTVLAQMSEIVFKLCDNAKGVLDYFSKVHALPQPQPQPQPQQQPHPLIDLIKKACNGSLDVDFCISSLTSDPRTISTDPTGLTAITIDIAKTNATNVLAYIDHEVIAKGYYNDSVFLCDGKYQNAVQELRRADAAFKGGRYPSTSQFIQDAISDILLCGGKEIKTAPPLLAQMSEIVFKLCDNAKGVLGYFSKVRALPQPPPQQQHPSFDLIEKACNGTIDIDFCISSLTSDPRTTSIDPKGLTAITIDIAKTNATAVLAYITNELIGKGITNNSISNCESQYQNVAKQLEQANVDFKRGSYDSTGQLIQNSLSDVVLCKGDEILTVAIPPLLTQMCDGLLKLCDNARELVCYSSKVCGPKWYD